VALQPFFESTAGDPASLTRMIAFQTLDTVPALDSDLVPYKSYGGALTPQPTTIQRQSVLTRPMRELAMASKIDNAGRQLSMGDIDPGNHAQLINLLSLLQGYTLATALGHTRWRISQQQALDATQILNKWTHMNDSDKGIPIRHTDCITRSMALTLQPRANASLVFGVEAGRFDHWEIPVVTGTGAVKPILRGTTAEQWGLDATDSDVFIQITSDSATEVVFKAKVATAGSYSSDQTATKGQWCYVYTGASSTVPLGGRAAQVEVYFPTGANGQFVDADVWEFEKRRVLTVVDADYPDPYPLAETQFRFEVNGVPIYVDNGVTLNVDVPGAVTRYAAGGSQAIGTDRKGQHDITVNLDRRLVDLELQKALMTADTVSLVIDGRNDTVVGTSVYYWGARFVMPYLSIEGPMHDAEAGAQNFNEVLTLRAFKPTTDFTYDGITDFGADLEVVWDTDLVATDLGL
jgi:hypothetical protein